MSATQSHTIKCSLNVSVPIDELEALLQTPQTASAAARQETDELLRHCSCPLRTLLKLSGHVPENGGYDDEYDDDDNYDEYDDGDSYGQGCDRQKTW